jgi:hypothetical protein
MVRANMIKKYLAGEPTYLVTNNGDGTRTIQSYSVDSTRFEIERIYEPYSDGRILGTIGSTGLQIVFNEPGFPQPIEKNGILYYRCSYRYVFKSTETIDSNTSSDTDNDGCPDIYDSAPNDPSYSNCSEPNPDCQIDSDGDGVMDCNDPAPNDPTYPKQGDKDNDNIPDDLDPYPEDDSDFNYKLAELLTDADDNIVGFSIETDRGDFFSYNMDSDQENLTKTTVNNSEFTDNLDNLKQTLEDLNIPEGSLTRSKIYTEPNDSDIVELDFDLPPPPDSPNPPDIPEIETPQTEDENQQNRDAALEKAIKENSNITKQASENSTTQGKAINDSLQQLKNKVNFTGKSIENTFNKNTDKIVNALNGQDSGNTSDLTASDIGEAVANKNDEKRRTFSDEQSNEIDNSASDIPEDSSDFQSETGINPDSQDSIHNFGKDKIDKVMGEQDSSISEEEKTQIDSQIKDLKTKTDFDKFSINLNSPKCTYEADLGDMGTYTISICPYEDELRFVGNIFFFSFALTGYVVMLRS